jgi:chemotaxis protein CheX
MTSLASEIETVVGMIWSSFVDVPISVDGHTSRINDPTVTGIVNIEGAWRGAVVVRCPYALAALVTAAMLESEAVSLDDVRDALGELTNMVAGNLKALLPEPSTISLPTVAFGSDYEIDVLGTRVVASVPFTSESHPLFVSLVQRSDDGKGSKR